MFWITGSWLESWAVIKNNTSQRNQFTLKEKVYFDNEKDIQMILAFLKYRIKT